MMRGKNVLLWAGKSTGQDTSFLLGAAAMLPLLLAACCCGLDTFFPEN
jgi:hypothetical protein